MMKRTLVLLFLSWTVLLAAQEGPKTAAEIQQAIKDGKASFIVINTTPSGAQITLDGKLLAPLKTPVFFALFKKEAPRIITITLDGYKPVERRVDPTGSPVAVEAALEPLSTASNTTPDPAPVSTAKATAASVPSPFGFRYGSSKDEVLKQLGAASVVKTADNLVTFNTAPSPHSDFELYTLYFSPRKGLLKVSALSKDIRTGDDGSELRSTFSRLKSALESKYGPSKSLDNCKGGSVTCEPQFFMMQLLEQNRSLFALWEVPAIVIEAKALSINKGYIRLTYEFPGWDEFVDTVNTKKNSVF